MLTASVAAFAQSAELVAKFKKMDAVEAAPASTEIESAALPSVMRLLEKSIFDCRPTHLKVVEILPAIADRRIGDAVLAKRATNGWTANLSPEGCLNPKVIRVFVARQIDRNLIVGVFGFGPSIAGFAQTVDADFVVSGSLSLRAHSLDTATVAALNACPEMLLGAREVVNSVDLGPDVFGVRFTGSWEEIWHSRRCGYDIATPVKFQADGQGGASINVTANDIVVTPVKISSTKSVESAVQTPAAQPPAALPRSEKPRKRRGVKSLPN